MSLTTPLRARLASAMCVDARWAEERLRNAEGRLARGQVADRILHEVDERLTRSALEVVRRRSVQLQITYPEHLPVSQRRGEIIAALRAHPVLVLTGETGSGKTTQLPKMLLEAGYGRRGLVALTQPRRIAAIAMAARISEECAAGPAVIAHSVRFDDRANADTVVRVMTDGLLLAEVAQDPELSRYDAVIIDEAHERSLNIDLLLGLVHLLRRRRPDLAVVIASASIEAERFARYFDAPIIAVEGRMFPVDIRYAPLTDEDDIGYQRAAVSAIRSLVEAGESGDMLVFLPTERDIIEIQRKLDELPGTAVLPLFSRLTPAEQQRVFQPPPGRAVRKVVLATNIAETSLTIPGIRFVIDTGLARFKRYQAASRTERLPIEAISRASATQRAGRAGRVEAGVCIRLYAEEDFDRRDAYTSPEILRSNLAGVMLTCLSMGLGEPLAFPWLDAPSSSAWDQARILLEELGAVEGHKLTPLGRTVGNIPADPQVARILIAGITEGCPHEACTIAAFLSVQDPRLRPLGQEAKADAAHRLLAHEAGDLATVLRLWHRWEAAGGTSAKARMCEPLFLGFRRMREWADVRHQLWDALRSSGRYQLPPHGAQSEEWQLDRVHRAVLAGMLGNVLMHDREKRCYRGAGERELHVHPGSALRGGKADEGKKAAPAPPWLVACEVVETSRLFARLCAPIDPQWIVDLVGDRVKKSHRDPQWRSERKQVVCIETLTWKGLPVREGRLVPYGPLNPDDAHRIFIQQALVSEDGIGTIPLIVRNRAVLRLAVGLRHRLRDPSLEVVEEHLETWYRERFASARLASLDHLRGWLKEHGDVALTLSLADLTTQQVAARAEAGAPDNTLMGGKQFPLSYRFIPGDASDGVTLELVENEVHLIDLIRLDWLVPAWWPEQVEACVAQLPKEARRALIPLAEHLPHLVADLTPFVGRRQFTTALAEILRTRHGLRVTPPESVAWPVHLRPRFVIRSVDKAVIYEGREPVFLATQAGTADRLRLLRAEWETDPSAAWPGDLPPEGGQVGTSGNNGWVALGRARSGNGSVAFKRTVYGSRDAATAWHYDGLDAGLEAHFSTELESIALASVSGTLAARWEKQFNQRLGAFRRQAALSAVLEIELGQVKIAEDWHHLLTRCSSALAAVRNDIDGLAERIVCAADEVSRIRRQGTKTLLAAQSSGNVGLVVDRLLATGWSARLPWSALRRVDQFVTIQGKRLAPGGAGPGGRLEVRASDRIQGLFTAWDDLLGTDSSRLVLTLGQTRTVRSLWGCLHECVHALVSGSGAQAAEMRLRLGLEDINHQLSAARDRIAESRQSLLEVSRIVPRIVVAERRTRMESELNLMLKDFPDLSLGADLAGQHFAVHGLLTRIRAAL